MDQAKALAADFGRMVARVSVEVQANNGSLELAEHTARIWAETFVTLLIGNSQGGGK